MKVICGGAPVRTTAKDAADLQWNETLVIPGGAPQMTFELRDDVEELVGQGTWPLWLELCACAAEAGGAI